MPNSTPYTSYGMLLSRVRELGMVGQDPFFLQAVRRAGRLADSPEPAAIVGERGTGKSRMAALIHSLSRHRPGKLLPVDCAVLTHSEREGLLDHFEPSSNPFDGPHLLGQRAVDGTLLLEHFEQLSPRLASRLLTIAREHIIHLREHGSIPAEHPRLLFCVRDADCLKKPASKSVQPVGEFLYRNRLRLPALCERIHDIPMIAESIIERYRPTHTAHRKLSKSAVRYLLQCSYPQNIDTLERMVRGAIDCSGQEVLFPEDFDFHARSDALILSEGYWLPDIDEQFSLESYLREVRTQLVLKALQKSRGNQSKAARMLRISPQAVHQFIKTRDLGAVS